MTTSSEQERRVLRHEVAIDDQWHRIEYTGEVVHVASRSGAVVEFWTVDARHELLGPRAAEFRVHGTGHPVDAGLYEGTAIAPGGVLVWHLFSREAQS